MRGAKGKYDAKMPIDAEALMAKGMLQKDVATLLGISTASFHAWQEQHPEFLEAIKRGQARCREFHINNIAEAGKKSWQSSAWYLERTNDEFKLRQDLNLTGTVVNIDHNVKEKDPKKLQEIIKQLIK